MALDAADALFMDELFADLDASHFSIPPSQSPPKNKSLHIPALSQRSPPKYKPSLSRASIPRARSPLAESSRFQSQPSVERDIEDLFSRTPDAKGRRAVSSSTHKRQKVEHELESATLLTPTAAKPTSVVRKALPSGIRQPVERCSYTRCRVLAVVDSTYEVDIDAPGPSKRTRPEKLLVLETDSHSKKPNRAASRSAGTQADTNDDGPKVLLASLRDDWMQTMVSTGNIVHLVGRFDGATRTIPITLEPANNQDSTSTDDSQSNSKLQESVDESRNGLPRQEEAGPPSTKEPGDDDDEDDLWDDLASMPSLSQCATQELLASNDSPKANIMVFASRSSTSPTAQDDADHALDNLLVVHPDLLVPATKVADVASCIRKPVVQDRLRSVSDVSLSLVMGNMLHELLQACLTASSTLAVKVEIDATESDGSALSPWPETWQGIGDFSRAFVESQVQVQVQANIESLYAIELGASQAATQLREKAAPFAHFARTFLCQDDSAAFHPEATLRESSRSAGSAPAKVRLRRILDVEEEIWSPVFGLKGKVDVSVECDILEGSDVTPAPAGRGAFSRGEHRPKQQDESERITTAVVPLELKTGRAEVVSTEHRAQTMLYTLMMSDRYGVRVSDGLLYYSKSGELHRISRSRNEVRSLIIGRNELAHYLRHDTSRLAKDGPEEAGVSSVLPPTIDSEYKCRKCYAVDGCMLFRRALEGVIEPSEEAPGTERQASGKNSKGVVLAKRTPIADVYEQKTEHLTAVHLDFFRKWDRLLSLEEEDAVRFRREMWTMSAEQREKVGRCFANMRLDALPYRNSGTRGSGSMRRIVHRFIRHCDPTQPAESGLLAGHITVNDPVTISIEPDMLSVAQGFVARLTPTEVEIGLDHPLDVAMRRALEKNAELKPAQHFDVVAAADKIVFRIDKDELGSGMGRMRANLAALFLTPQKGGDVKRRELIVDMRPPRFVAPALCEQEAIQAVHADASLNEDQKAAIAKVLSAQDYALVLGMPGTGKTTTIAKLIELLVKLGKRILLTSYTHSAVDTILRKLGSDVGTQQKGMHILRLGSKEKVHPDAHEFLLPRCQSLEELKDAFESPNVVAATCLSVHHTFFSSGMAKTLRNASQDSEQGASWLFDYCIVDEASQIPLPTCLGPLRFADKFVLVGDHHQLPPLVKNAQARMGGLDVSLFKSLSDTWGQQAVVKLTHQYRMNRDIMELSNQLVYKGELKVGSQAVGERSLVLPNPHAAMHRQAQPWLNDLLRPETKVRFLDTSSQPMQQVEETKTGELVQNNFEANLVLTIVSALLAGGVNPNQIAVVTPYRQQLKLLASLFLSNANGWQHIELLTADQSQGRDKDVILLTLTRANSTASTGQLLNDPRRLNVSLTRAKRKLILIGHTPTLNNSKVLNPLISLCQQKGWLRTLGDA